MKKNMSKLQQSAPQQKHLETEKSSVQTKYLKANK